MRRRNLLKAASATAGALAIHPVVTRADPVPSGNPSGLDKKYAHKISLVWHNANETYYMFYCAVGNKGRGIGLITSKQLVHDKHYKPDAGEGN